MPSFSPVVTKSVPVGDVSSSLLSLPSKSSAANVPASVSSPKGVLPTPSSPVDLLVGTCVSVFWPKYKGGGKWYPGTVVSKSNPNDGGTHDIAYDDEEGQDPVSEKLTGRYKVKWVPISDSSSSGDSIPASSNTGDD